MREYYVAWWNLENLFSVQDDPDRPAWLQKQLASELAGWDQDVLTTKIAQLARIIMQMNGGTGPDLLGVCEIENAAVLKQLIGALAPLGRKYRVAHHDTADQRGIDVAFIYDGRRFKARKREMFSHVILKRTSTRDLFQVNFYTKPAGNLLICVGNHWPSKLGGELESEPYRILAGETLAYWMTRIQEIFAEKAVAAGTAATLSQAVPPAVLVMGDMNDEPHNRSLTDYALSLRDERRVKSRRSRNPYLWNLMWPLMGAGVPTHVFDGSPAVLDHMLVNRGLVDSESPLNIQRVAVEGQSAPALEILRFPEAVIPSGTSQGGPRRFSRPAKSDFDPGGFSDHFPLALWIVENA